MNPRVFAAVAALVPAIAFGHAYWTTPTARANVAYKAGPCGTPRTALFTTYTAGSTVTVTWRETINHPGYYELTFSPANDQNWQFLRLNDGGLANRIPNPANAQP